MTVSSNASVIFNGGDEGQTVDITVAELSQNAVYCEEDTDLEGHYLYGEWTYDPDSQHHGGDSGKMYMIPSTEWKSDGARFAAYFFGGGDPTWSNLKYAGENLYSVDIPEGYSNIIFVRMNGATTENNWNNKWNQTNDLTIEPGGTYTVNGWEN